MPTIDVVDYRTLEGARRFLRESAAWASDWITERQSQVPPTGILLCTREPRIDDLRLQNMEAQEYHRERETWTPGHVGVVHFNFGDFSEETINKNMAAIFLRQAAIRGQAVGALWISEIWMAPDQSCPASEHPQRREYLMLMGEHRVAGDLQAMALITRSDERVSVGEWIFLDTAADPKMRLQGRFTHFLFPDDLSNLDGLRQYLRALRCMALPTGDLFRLLVALTRLDAEGRTEAEFRLRLGQLQKSAHVILGEPSWSDPQP